MLHTPRSPQDIAADRARYEAHQRSGLEFKPKAPAEPTPAMAPPPPADQVIATETISGGWYWTTRLNKGEVLRLSAQSVTSTVSLAAWSADDRSERMNLPDTVKVQWTTALSKGRVVFSDMGRVMLSIIEDSSGAHDALTGGSAASTTKRSARENMILAAAKIGMDRRDLPPLLSFFAPVRLGQGGRFEWRGSMLSGHDWVELRAEMDLVLALSNTPHPLDPAAAEITPAMIATRLRASSVCDDDLCRTASAEAIRGFENNVRV